MVWAESIGQNVVVPGDKDTLNPSDTRDWISIGEDVPTELLPYLTAGIFFRAGQYVAAGTFPKVKYFGIGARNGQFFMFAYVENFQNTPGNHKLINLQSWGFDQDQLLLTAIGAADDNGNAVGDLMFRNRPRNQISYNSIDVSLSGGMNTTYFRNWSVRDASSFWDDLTLRLDIDGFVTLTGLLNLKLAVTANQVVRVCNWGSAFNPQRALMQTAMSNGQIMCRVDVVPGGLDLVEHPALSADTYLSINCRWPIFLG